MTIASGNCARGDRPVWWLFVHGCVLAAGLAACTPPSNATGPPVATVNGQPISQEFFAFYVREKSGVAEDKLDPTLRASLLHDLARLEAAALVGATGRSTETVLAIELSRLEILAKAAATAAGVYAAPTEAELRADYQRFLASQPTSEYRVAHILTASETMALGVVRRLDKNENFATLARNDSTDDSKWRGGELGWVQPGHLPAEFMDGVRRLHVGQYTEQPIKSPYGWHVIKLLETRSAKSPPFEDVKAQLISNLQEAHYRKFLERTLAHSGVR